MKKIILWIALALLFGNIQAQQNTNPQILVEGKSVVHLVPEEIMFNVNLSVKDSNYTRCAEMAVEKLAKIQALFLENGIDKDLIKSNSYSIREIQRHDPRLQQMVFDGYQADIPLTIKTKRDYTKNDLIFSLIKDNVESSFNMNFGLSEEQREAVKEELINLAVQDARQKAVIIAKSAQVKLGTINFIQYGDPRTINAMLNRSESVTSGIMPRMTADFDSKITNVFSPDEIVMATNILISYQIENQ